MRIVVIMRIGLGEDQLAVALFQMMSGFLLRGANLVYGGEKGLP